MKLKIRESNLISLNEMTLNRLVRGNSVDGYTILSACRGMFDKDANAVYFENGTPYRCEDDSPVSEEGLMNDEEEDWKINDLTQEFFTALKKYGTKKFPNYVGKPQRFTLEGVYLFDHPDTISSAHIMRLGEELCMPVNAWRKINKYF